MSEHEQSRFMKLFSAVPDPRKSEHLVKHSLFDMIFIAISACVSGVDDWQTIVLWAKTQEEWLRNYCSLENGIPSWWTFRRVFRILDPDALQKAFIDWMQGIQKATGSVVAIDGKTVRRSLDSKDGKGAIHVVSAWLSANRVVLGQRKVDDKSNEITAIPELLALLNIEGLVVTIDAMGCQKEIVSAIVDKKADYVLAVKDNQPNLHEDIQAAFSALVESTNAEPGYSTHERGHHLSLVFPVIVLFAAIRRHSEPYRHSLAYCDRHTRLAARLPTRRPLHSLDDDPGKPFVGRRERLDLFDLALHVHHERNDDRAMDAVLKQFPGVIYIVCKPFLKSKHIAVHELRHLFRIDMYAFIDGKVRIAGTRPCRYRGQKR